jgi:acyl dehydratase
MREIKYYWEDLQPGDVRDLGTISPSREDIVTFARQFDPQPFHPVSYTHLRAHETG